AALPGRHALADPGAGGGPRAAVAAASRRPGAARAGDDLPEMSGKGARQALRRRPRAGRRPGQLAGGSADPGAAAHAVAAVAQVAGTATARHDLGNAHYRLGQILRRLGRHSEAEDELRQAISLFEELTAADPEEPRYRSDLSGTCTTLGWLCQDRGRRPEAE